MNLLKKIILVLVNGPGKSVNESDNLTDEELVAKIVANNNTLLFSALYDRYSKKVYNKCYGFAKHQREAEDLTQDVFLKVFTKLHTFKGTAKFSTWLYVLTYNFCANYVNRDKNRKMKAASDSIENHDYYLTEVDEVKEEELFEIKVGKLEIALERIDPEDKAILLLKYQDDVSIKELESLLKIKESAVKMRLKRAKLRLIEAHKKIEDDE